MFYKKCEDCGERKKDWTCHICPDGCGEDQRECECLGIDYSKEKILADARPHP